MNDKYLVGDITAVFFPFSNFQRQKKRPVLIIACPKEKNEVIVAKISSVIKKGPYRIPIGERDVSKGMLPKTSEVDIAHLYTVEKALLCGKWAILQSEKKNTIIEAIKHFIGQ